VRGISIPVQYKKFKCYNCNESFESPEFDLHDKAYRIYREKFGMLTPERLKDIREQTLLGIEEFSKMSGMDADAIRRFENGALQDILSEMIYLKIAQMYMGE
jgi:DNA-binding transcriptional regulator YiaG